jgi:hypothetical protein
MLSPDVRARVTNLGDRLIELYTLRAEACGQEDWHRVRGLEEEIERAASHRQAILANPLGDPNGKA